MKNINRQNQTNFMEINKNVKVIGVNLVIKDLNFEANVKIASSRNRNGTNLEQWRMFKPGTVGAVLRTVFNRLVVDR